MSSPRTSAKGVADVVGSSNQSAHSESVTASASPSVSSRRRRAASSTACISTSAPCPYPGLRFTVFIVKCDVTFLIRGMVITRPLRNASYADRSATATRTK